MRQKCPLLDYRETMLSNDPNNDLIDIRFNIISGLWIDQLNRAVVSSVRNILRETTKTASVEGIDQSEISHAFSTTFTRTREGSDQTENSLLFSTIITESRTAPDQSECS